MADGDDDDGRDDDDEDDDDDDEWPPEIRSKHQPMKIPFGLPRPPPANEPLYFLQDQEDQPPGLEDAPAAPRSEDGFIFVQLPTRLPTTVAGEVKSGSSLAGAVLGGTDGPGGAEQGSEAGEVERAAHDRVLTNVRRDYSVYIQYSSD
jgi:hypothetical protein